MYYTFNLKMHLINLPVDGVAANVLVWIGTLMLPSPTGTNCTVVAPANMELKRWSGVLDSVSCDSCPVPIDSVTGVTDITGPELDNDSSISSSGW